jgi:hypothetical protein
MPKIGFQRFLPAAKTANKTAEIAGDAAPEALAAGLAT